MFLARRKEHYEEDAMIIFNVDDGIESMVWKKVGQQTTKDASVYTIPPLYPFT